MVKYTKMTREKMDDFLTRHGSSLSEAAKLAGTSRTTLTRHLDKGLVPTDWMTRIREGLKDRKPLTRHKMQKTVLCAICGKDISDDDREWATNNIGLQKLGMESTPVSGYYWEMDSTGKRNKMFRICSDCQKKLDKICRTHPKKTIKTKVTVERN